MTVMSIDSRTLRQTVGRFVTGVTVVAIDVEGEIRAMTANSFTSLSLDPPLVLFCLGKDTKAGRHIRSADTNRTDFHSGGSDVTALLVRDEGRTISLADTGRVVEEVVLRHPYLAVRLFDTFPHDRMGEDEPGAVDGAQPLDSGTTVSSTTGDSGESATLLRDLDDCDEQTFGDNGRRRFASCEWSALPTGSEAWSVRLSLAGDRGQQVVWAAE